jgi:hypothetical protein
VVEISMKVDMAMPETCGDCNYEVFAEETDGEKHRLCLFTEEVIVKEVSRTRRGNDCPLKEVK